MANRQRYRYYKPADGPGDVRGTYDAGSKKLKAVFRSRLATLASLAPQWRPPLAKQLAGDCDGLVEIRFFADNVQQRPLGFWSAQNEFTIVFWATEKGGKFVPLSACDRAHTRRKAILKDGTLSHELWINLD